MPKEGQLKVVDNHYTPHLLEKQLCVLGGKEVKILDTIRLDTVDAINRSK